MKSMMYALVGFILLLSLPMLLTEMEAPPETTGHEIVASPVNQIDMINLSVANDIEQPGIVRLKILNDNIEESYLIDSSKELPEKLTYSALRPHNQYGIILEGRTLMLPDRYRSNLFGYSYLPAKHNFRQMIASRE